MEYYETDFGIMNDDTLSNMNLVRFIGNGTFGKVCIFFRYNNFFQRIKYCSQTIINQIH